MKKIIIAGIIVFMVISLSAFGSSAQNANPPGQFERQDQNRGQNPDGPGGPGGPGGPDQSRGQRPPEVHFIGFAVEGEEKFEMANLFFLPPPPPQAMKRGQGDIKRPDAVIAVGKQEYFIVEAKIETEEAKIEQMPGQPENGNGRGGDNNPGVNAGGQNRPKPVKIKSCEGKLSKTYFERPNNPPEPGKSGQDQEMPKGKADIVGDIKIGEVEKEVGKDGKGKVAVMYGTMSTADQKFTLYLEPRLMPPPPPGRRNGQNQQDDPRNRPEMKINPQGDNGNRDN